MGNCWGLEEWWGLWETFLGSLFSFSNKKSVFNHLGAREWLGLPGPVFGWPSGTRGDDLNESESFHLKGSIFKHLCAVDWPVRRRTSFQPSWMGGESFKWKGKFYHAFSFVCSIFWLYCQCLIRSGRRKYSGINVRKYFQPLYGNQLLKSRHLKEMFKGCVSEIQSQKWGCRWDLSSVKGKHNLILDEGPNLILGNALVKPRILNCSHWRNIRWERQT